MFGLRKAVAVVLALALACAPVAFAANNLSNYLENKLLDHALGKTSFTMPSTYVALCNADPTEAGTGCAEVKTPGSSGYARQALSPNTTAAASGASDNTAALTFGPATDNTWAQVNFVAVLDATSGGNVLWHAPITVRTVASGDSYVIAIGAIDFSID